MADKKTLKKEIKKLRKRVKKAMERNLKAQQELDRLQEKMAESGGRMREISGHAEDIPGRSPRTEAMAGTALPGLASVQRASWKRHKYLRDRYECHLVEGRDKTDARRLANADLVGKYGEESGFSEQDLEGILT